MHKILIADDDARMRGVIKQVVRSLVSEVLEARNGVEAVALYAEQQPQWVLMDLRMKPMDGLHATVQIKARFPEARIAIVSQFDEDELRSEAARAGACAYILKENLHELHQLLKTANQNRKRES